MKITHISARFVKGQTFQHPIEKVTIFAGPNGIGKSARLDTIQLALLGYKPGLGEKNDKIFMLSGHHEMAVEVTLDCGQARRKWTRDFEDSIKSSKKIDPSVPDLPAILLDHNEYFGLSADKRTEFFFGQVKIDTTRFNPNTFIAKLKGLKVENHTTLHEEVLSAFIAELANSADVMRHSRSTLQEWLEAESVALTEKTRTTRATIDRMTKTIAGMTQLEIQHATELTESVPSLEGKQRDLRKVIENLRLAVDRMERLKALMEKVSKDPVAAKMGVEDALVVNERQSTEFDSLEDPTEAQMACARALDSKAAEMKALNAEIERLSSEQVAAGAKRARLKELTESLEQFPDCSATIAEMNKRIEEIQTRHDVYQPKNGLRLAECVRIQSSLDNVQKELEQSANRISATSLDLTRILATPACPTCLSDTPGWQARLKADYENRIANEATHQNDCKRRIEIFEKDLLREQAAYREALDSDNALETEFQKLLALKRERDDLLVAQAKHDKTKAALEAIGDIPNHIEQLGKMKEQRELCEHQLGKLNSELSVAQDRHQAWKANQSKRGILTSHIASGKETLLKLADVMQQMQALEVRTFGDLEDQLSGLKMRIVEFEKDIEEVAIRIKQSGGMQQDLKRNKEAELERNKAVAEMELWQAVRSELRKFQAEIAETAFGPILSRANAITRSVLKAELTVEHGQLGRRDGERWISVDTFSQAQKAVTYAAMCCALAIDAPFKLVMIDNMNDMDDGNATAFIKDMIALVDNGTIQQFVGADCRVYPYIDPSTVGEHFPGSVDPVPMGKPFKGLTLITLQ